MKILTKLFNKTYVKISGILGIPPVNEDQVTTYKERRPSIKTGDVVAFRSSVGTSILDGIYAKIITLLTKRHIHHVAIVYASGNRIFIVEATPPYSRMVPLSNRGDFYHISMGIDNTPELENTILNTIGTIYSIPDAITSWATGKVMSGNGLQCVESVKDILTHSGVPVPESFLPGKFIEDLRVGRELVYVSPSEN